MKSLFTFLVAAAFILGNAASAAAQSVSKPVVIGEEFTLYSSVLKQALTKLGIELSNPATR